MKMISLSKAVLFKILDGDIVVSNRVLMNKIIFQRGIKV